MNEPGVSGILGPTLGIRPLGGLLVSIPSCSNCEWWFALSIPLVNLVSAVKWPCNELSSWTPTLFAVRWMLEVLSVLMIGNWYLSPSNLGPHQKLCQLFLYTRCYDINNSCEMVSSSWICHFP